MQELTKYITIINLTFLFSIITPLLLLYIKFDLDRKTSKEGLKLKEIAELNKKMHDRLVETEELMKAEKYLTDQIKRRLLYTSSRLKKYDKSIWKDVNLLINSWEDALFQKERGNINDGELSKSRTDLINLIEKIISKVDKL